MPEHATFPYHEQVTDPAYWEPRFSAPTPPAWAVAVDRATAAWSRMGVIETLKASSSPDVIAIRYQDIPEGQPLAPPKTPFRNLVRFVLDSRWHSNGLEIPFNAEREGYYWPWAFNDGAQAILDHMGTVKPINLTMPPRSAYYYQGHSQSSNTGGTQYGRDLVYARPSVSGKQWRGVAAFSMLYTRAHHRYVQHDFVLPAGVLVGRAYRDRELPHGDTYDYRVVQAQQLILAEEVRPRRR